MVESTIMVEIFFIFCFSFELGIYRSSRDLNPKGQSSLLTDTVRR